MVNSHFLPCAWCAFIFFCAFIPPDLLENPHGIFVYPLSRTLSSTKGQTTSSSFRVRARHHPLTIISWYDLPPSLRTLCLVNFSPLSIFPLSPFQTHFLHIYFHFIHSPVQWSWLWTNKVIRKKEGKCRHAHAQSLFVTQPDFSLLPHLALSCPLF